MIFTPFDIVMMCSLSFSVGNVLTLIMTLRYLKNNMEQEPVVVAQSVHEPSRAVIYVQRE